METLPNVPKENQTIKKEKAFTCNRVIITNLIKQDLINWKMVNLFQKMQIHADDYQLDIGSIIFEIMDLDEPQNVDELFEKYIEMSRPILKLSASQSNRKIDLLASKIYDYLEQYSQK